MSANTIIWLFGLGGLSVSIVAVGVYSIIGQVQELRLHSRRQVS